MLEGLFRLVANTYVHNQLVIGLTLAAAASLLALLRRPTRQHVFFLIGFLALILHFEYQKHIVADLTDQTLFTLFEEKASYRGRWLTTVMLYHLLPLLMWLVGWGSVILGIANPQWGKLRRFKRHR